MLYYIFAAVTLGILIYLPTKLKLWETPGEEDENTQILKQAGVIKRRRGHRKNI